MKLACCSGVILTAPAFVSNVSEGRVAHSATEAHIRTSTAAFMVAIVPPPGLRACAFADHQLRLQTHDLGRLLLLRANHSQQNFRRLFSGFRALLIDGG